MKNLFLDTTYVLPLFGIAVNFGKNNGTSKIDELKLLWKNGIEGYHLYLSTISLIEVVYKLNIEFRKSGNIEVFRRYELALPTIKGSPHVELFDPHLNIKTMHYFSRIRTLGHKDLMDCWILGSAAALGAIFLSQDITLRKLVSKDEELGKIPFWNWAQLRKAIDII